MEVACAEVNVDLWVLVAGDCLLLIDNTVGKSWVERILEDALGLGRFDIDGSV